MVADVVVSRQYFHVTMFIDGAVTTNFMGNVSIETRNLRFAIKSYVDAVLFGIFMIDNGHAVKVFHCVGEFLSTYIINHIYEEYLIDLRLHNRVGELFCICY